MSVSSNVVRGVSLNRKANLSLSVIYYKKKSDKCQAGLKQPGRNNMITSHVSFSWFNIPKWHLCLGFILCHFKIITGLEWIACWRDYDKQRSKSNLDFPRHRPVCMTKPSAGPSLIVRFKVIQKCHLNTEEGLSKTKNSKNKHMEHFWK